MGIGMTKDEFIDRFLERSGMPKACRTADGVKDGHFERVVTRCNCGEAECVGWQMVKPTPVAKGSVTVRFVQFDVAAFEASFNSPENLRTMADCIQRYMRR